MIDFQLLGSNDWLYNRESCWDNFCSAFQVLIILHTWGRLSLFKSCFSRHSSYLYLQLVPIPEEKYLHNNETQILWSFSKILRTSSFHFPYKTI